MRKILIILAVLISLIGGTASPAAYAKAEYRQFLLIKVTATNRGAEFAEVWYSRFVQEVE